MSHRLVNDGPRTVELLFGRLSHAVVNGWDDQKKASLVDRSEHYRTGAYVREDDG